MFTDSLGDDQVASSDPNALIEGVEAVLSVPDAELDYARAKVSLDALIDPEADTDRTFAELDRLTEAASALAGPNPSEVQRLRSVRTVIYEAGPWNGGRGLAYDMSDPDGLNLSNALLHNYLRTGLGQCVSMPILFLIIADRLGLDVALACAPNHLFVRYAAPDGQVFNLEITSGGHPARLDWFRQEMPMSDRALAKGLYMRSLPRRGR
jgi:regulator of sirC expression with transglutaminase-like and TPR domain